MKLLGAFLLGLLLAAVASAQTASQSAGAPSASAVDHAATFKEVDKNGDGRISRAEAAADGLLNDGFAKLDTNRDGSLSIEEYGKRLRAR